MDRGEQATQLDEVASPKRAAGAEKQGSSVHHEVHPRTVKLMTEVGQEGAELDLAKLEKTL